MMTGTWFAPVDNDQVVAGKLVPRLAYDKERRENWRSQLRDKARSLVGLPERDGSGLDVRVLWEQDDELGSITKLVFTAEERADVPCYFCVPHGAVAPYTTVICLQGHTSGMHNSIGRAFEDERRRIEVPGDRDFALSAMRHGFAALCIEQRGFGERTDPVEAGDAAAAACHDPAMRALLVGRTLLGERVFDVDRAIDYLESRGDIATEGVGVMGNSGGGTVSIYAAALLDRVGFAMPSCSFATFAGSIFSIHHCVDNYVPGILRWAECADVLGLFAPKPIVVVTGRYDDIFPLARVVEAYRKLEEIYVDAGAGGACALVVGDGGHRFYAKEGWAKMRELLAQGGPRSGTTRWALS